MRGRTEGRRGWRRSEKDVRGLEDLPTLAKELLALGKGDEAHALEAGLHAHDVGGDEAEGGGVGAEEAERAGADGDAVELADAHKERGEVDAGGHGARAALVVAERAREEAVDHVLEDAGREARRARAPRQREAEDVVVKVDRDARREVVLDHERRARDRRAQHLVQRVLHDARDDLHEQQRAHARVPRVAPQQPVVPAVDPALVQLLRQVLPAKQLRSP